MGEWALFTWLSVIALIIVAYPLGSIPSAVLVKILWHRYSQAWQHECLLDKHATLLRKRLALNSL